MSVMNYKCPACGAPIEFNPQLGKFKCGYCFTEHTEEDLTAYLEKLQAKTATAESGTENSSSGNADSNTTAAGSSGEKDRQTVKAYQCNNCGAEVVAGDTSTAVFCYYCHSPVVITDRLKGDFKPDRIIPFQVDKKTAVQTFLKWAGKKKYIPSDFTSTMQQEKITGMYLPYWQADITAAVDYHAIGVNTTHWTDGEYDYTKVDKYQVDRSGTVSLNNLQKCAFSKINESLINGIEPYDKEGVKPFSAGYLAGFFAENYTEDKEAITPALIAQAKETTGNIIARTSHCSRFEKEQDNTRYKAAAHRYVLLPSWILTYIYKGKTYVFAVNGQTGKSYGELPLNKGKAFLTSCAAGAAVSVLLLLGGYFIW